MTILNRLRDAYVYECGRCFRQFVSLLKLPVHKARCPKCGARLIRKPKDYP